MINYINIEGIRLYGYHGCLDEEAKVGGHYLVDVRMQTDFMSAAKTDNLTQTIDYCQVYEICKREMAIRSKLIEHVCDRIFNSLVAELNGLIHLEVKVIKLNPPMNGDVPQVSVVMAKKLA